MSFILNSYPVYVSFIVNAKRADIRTRHARAVYLRLFGCWVCLLSTWLPCCVFWYIGRVQLKHDGTRWRTGGELKGKLANGVEWVTSTLHSTSELSVSSISAATSQLNPADLNGLVRFAERRNLVSARVPSQFKRSLPVMRRSPLNHCIRGARQRPCLSPPHFTFYLLLSLSVSPRFLYSLCPWKRPCPRHSFALSRAYSYQCDVSCTLKLTAFHCSETWHAPNYKVVSKLTTQGYNVRKSKYCYTSVDDEISTSNRSFMWNILVSYS
jgi:hypothetical protein